MAAFSDHSDDYVGRLNRESGRLEAETRKLMAEASKANAERSLAMAKPDWFERVVFPHTGRFLAFILMSAIAIMGLGAGFALLF